MMANEEWHGVLCTIDDGEEEGIDYCKEERQIGKRQYGWKKKEMIHEQDSIALFWMVCTHLDGVEERELVQESEIEFSRTSERALFYAHGSASKFERPRIDDLLRCFYNVFFDEWSRCLPCAVLPPCNVTFRRRNASCTLLQMWDHKCLNLILEDNGMTVALIQLGVEGIGEQSGEGGNFIPTRYSVSGGRAKKWSHFYELMSLVSDVICLVEHDLMRRVEAGRNGNVVDIVRWCVERSKPVLVDLCVLKNQ